MTKSSIMAEKWPIFEKKLGQNLKELSRTLIFKQVFSETETFCQFSACIYELWAKNANTHLI